MGTSETDGVIKGSRWKGRYGAEQGKVLTVLDRFAPGSEDAKKWGGLVKYSVGGVTGVVPPQAIIDWGVPLAPHDLSSPYQPKGMRACGTCLELWPVDAKEPEECKPDMSGRPAQEVIEEKVAILMAGG